MLATPVVIELLGPCGGYKKGTQLLAVGGAAWAVTAEAEVGPIEARLLCFDEAGDFLWVPLSCAKAAKPSEVVAAQAGVPLPS